MSPRPEGPLQNSQPPPNQSAHSPTPDPVCDKPWPSGRGRIARLASLIGLLAPMNKDAQGRWKVGMSNTKLKMRAKTILIRVSGRLVRFCTLRPARPS